MMVMCVVIAKYLDVISYGKSSFTFLKSVVYFLMKNIWEFLEIKAFYEIYTCPCNYWM